MNAYQLAPSSTPFVHLPPRCFLRPSQYVTLPVHSSAAAHSAFASSPDEARCGGRASEIARAEAALGARRGLLSRQLRPCAPSDSAVRLIVPPLPPAQGCQGCGENPPRLPPAKEPSQQCTTLDARQAARSRVALVLPSESCRTDERIWRRSAGFAEFRRFHGQEAPTRVARRRVLAGPARASIAP